MSRPWRGTRWRSGRGLDAGTCTFTRPAASSAQGELHGLRRQPVGLHKDLDAVLRLRVHKRLHAQDRKSTRLNSSHLVISYAVFCLKKKKEDKQSCIYIIHSTVNRRMLNARLLLLLALHPSLLIELQISSISVYTVHVHIIDQSTLH